MTQYIYILFAIYEFKIKIRVGECNKDAIHIHSVKSVSNSLATPPKFKLNTGQPTLLTP